MTTASFAKMLTTTMTHLRGSGTGAKTTIASGIACSPADPLGASMQQNYETEKFYITRQCFTAYTAVLAGDYVTIGSTTYEVQAIMPFAALGAMDAYTQLILEEQG